VARIVEDGSIVAGANSYVSVASARAYATERGLSLSVDDSVVEAQLVIAMDYLESLRDKYQGSKTDITTPQALQWPRQDVTLDGEDFDENSIPVELTNAQCRLAVEQESGIELMPTQDGKFIIKDKTGPLETTYSDKIVPSSIPSITSVEVLLKPLLAYRFRHSTLRTVRV